MLSQTSGETAECLAELLLEKTHLRFIVYPELDEPAKANGCRGWAGYFLNVLTGSLASSPSTGLRWASSAPAAEREEPFAK